MYGDQISDEINNDFLNIIFLFNKLWDCVIDYMFIVIVIDVIVMLKKDLKDFFVILIKLMNKFIDILI